MRRIWPAGCAAAVFVLAGSLLADDGLSAPAPAISEPLCFSNVCLDGAVNDVAQLTLADLKRIRAPNRKRAEGAMSDLAAAYPRMNEDDRKALLNYSDSDGRLLIDASTLPILLRIDQICGGGQPFVALFMSESGHPTSVRLEAVANEGALRLGVTELARHFRVRSHSPEEQGLIADLSQKFGFRVDDAYSVPRPQGTKVDFERQADGFLLRFRAAVRAVEPLGPALPGCPASNRLKID
jgi:hypothetical protein